MSLFSELIYLFYPEVCAACDNQLVRGEEFICLSCHYHLPKTDFHLFRDNPLARSFWGKLPIENAAAYLFFNKGEKVQKLIHNFKYRGQTELGVYLGKLYGLLLIDVPLFQQADFVIPVPMHSTKKEKRGFNQSEIFASGLALSMKKEFGPDFLRKKSATETQTNKSSYQRWENVKDIFELASEEVYNLLQGKHVILVDDVVTTGSTLEACASALLKVPGIRISMVTMAYANKI